MPDGWCNTITWGFGHGDVTTHLQPPQMGQNLAVAEWLVSMVIVGIEGFVRPTIAFWWLNILYIGCRWMVHYNNLGLGSW